MNDLVGAALDYGFSHAALMDPATLKARDEVRAMCAENRCGAYGACWACPPACGSLDESRKVIAGFRSGLLVQTTAVLDDPFDYDEMLAAGEKQKKLLIGFRKRLRRQYPELRALANGACTICEVCNYPAAPCRHPAQMVESMEAFGLIVADVCSKNDLDYYYGSSTITYTGCYLLEQV